MASKLNDELNDDDELAAAAFRIREAGDFAAAINIGARLRREVPQSDVDIAQNAAALLHMMFPDELDALKDALSRARTPDLPPLVQTFLVITKFWPSHEKNRRLDANRDALVSANGGHMVGLTFDGNGPEGLGWYGHCECLGEEDALAYRETRDEALADLTAHMFEYGLTEAVIDHIEEEG